MKKTIQVNSLSQMRDLAKHVISYKRPGFLVCLEGDLGAGKTTFTQFLGEFLGIEDRINSPTFTILKTYHNDKSLNLYHIDAYRLSDDFTDYDIEEYIEGDGVCVVEWYTNILDVIPEERLSLEIEWTGETSRRIKLEGSGYYAQIVETIGD